MLMLKLLASMAGKQDNDSGIVIGIIQEGCVVYGPPGRRWDNTTMTMLS